MKERAAMRDRVAAVRPTADRDGRAPGFTFEDVASRSGARDCAEHGQLREIDADRSAEASRPGTAGTDDHRCRDAPLLGNHTLNATCEAIDAANRAMAEDLRATALGGAGDCRRRAAGFGSRIARGVQRSAPAPIIGSKDRREVLRIEKSSI